MGRHGEGWLLLLTILGGVFWGPGASLGTLITGIAIIVILCVIF
jgi:hypothetical protein